MTNPVTAVAPANIALIKYWGMTDPTAVLPANPSLSMTLSRCVSHCTAEKLDAAGEDELWWRTPDGGTVPAPAPIADGIRRHLLRLRGDEGPALRITTGNTFPTAAGIASSASGFTALTLAVTTLLGRQPDPADLSVLSRLSGSGSAARSAYGGYVRWPGTPEDPSSAAAPVLDADAFPLCDVIAVVDNEPKEISSREGHRRAVTSPYFSRRLETLPARTATVERALREGDFAALAEAVEQEAVDLHLIAMSAGPPVFYWQPATVALLALARELRADGLDVCATIDAGPNVHLLTTAAHRDQVMDAVTATPGVLTTIADETGTGPYLTDAHLTR
ncbi:diphosphomevalonate decarboxylase [Streptomyces sp. NPDC006482]|uniref:diphosphomevalonate decarboxylase n=1 Tax=Streptomyces sp. NPDC006482 TaxID=3154306 RepID=UPI0033A00C04